MVEFTHPPSDDTTWHATNQPVRAFTFIHGSSRLSCFTASASWVAHYNRNSLSHEPLTTFKNHCFLWSFDGCMSIAPPKKRKTSSSHSILAVALTYKQLQTCVFKKASHIIKKARSPPCNRGKWPKRTKKNEWILKQLHGNRDISRNPVTPFKGPWQTRTIKQSGFASFSPCFCRRATSAFRRITSRKSLQNNVWILLWATANLFLPLFHGDI